MRSLFSMIPLLIIPVGIYNVIAFIGGSPDPAGFSPLLATMSEPMVTVPMISGVKWMVTNGDMLILLSAAILFLEILKSTSTGTSTIMNHGFSMVLFIACLIEFLLFSSFATSAFFIITVMTLLDVLAGVVVTIVSARRDFAVGDGFG